MPTLINSVTHSQSHLLVLKYVKNQIIQNKIKLSIAPVGIEISTRDHVGVKDNGSQSHLLVLKYEIALDNGFEGTLSIAPVGIEI